MGTFHYSNFQYFVHCHPYIGPVFIFTFGSLIRSLFGYNISTRFKRDHIILGMPTSKALSNTLVFIYKWIILPSFNKIVFLFTSHFYKQQVIASYKVDIRNQYKHKIEDLEDQVRLLEQERQRLIDVYDNRNGNTDEVYWRGAKYGYSLAQKGGKPFEHTGSKKLTEAHLFTLTEIMRGNRTINGLVGAYLEERGYVQLVWDDQAENKYHYEITDKGIKRIEKQQAADAKRLTPAR